MGHLCFEENTAVYMYMREKKTVLGLLDTMFLNDPELLHILLTALSGVRGHSLISISY